MIYYICHGRHAYTLAVFLEYFRNDFKERVRIISYDDLFRLRSINIGVFIFTDYDRISHEQHRHTTEFIAYLQRCDPNVVILNDPARCLGRYDLLAALHAENQHAPAVAKLQNWQQVRDFPVFIRGESDHLSALSGLIETSSELEVAAQQFLIEHPTPDDLIIIQFKNAPNAKGYYEKYGAFRVGDVIYGQHLFQNESWWVKDNGADWTEGRGLQSRDYVSQNPHADLLMPYFEMAGIEYGRVDYCMMNGQVVVFEINTNPVVNANPQKPTGRFVAQDYADLHNAALAQLPHVDGPLLQLPAAASQNQGTTTVEKAHQRMINKTQRKLRGRRLRVALKQLRSTVVGRFRVD